MCERSVTRGCLRARGERCTPPEWEGCESDTILHSVYIPLCSSQSASKAPWDCRTSHAHPPSSSASSARRSLARIRKLRLLSREQKDARTMEDSNPSGETPHWPDLRYASPDEFISTMTTLLAQMTGRPVELKENNPIQTVLKQLHGIVFDDNLKRSAQEVDQAVHDSGLRKALITEARAAANLHAL
ncbi:hypothetical protein BU23DRAFT_574043 [Bimuria novae-zelandiae CBS 107.79]|uniref:Uncharacterized protein n=1 Tax=Bimuria novae-zelandiae CBS 107.79 TaxID=1447943 RepID=A0A6A5UMG5_9PLEO|nr:hypothetical protein BU23DRAFT_574043 [Bimuria novae-zelandiae CBS 107.79]